MDDLVQYLFFQLDLVDLSGNIMTQAAAEKLSSMMINGKVEKVRLKSCNMDFGQLSQIFQGFRDSKGKVC